MRSLWRFSVVLTALLVIAGATSGWSEGPAVHPTQVLRPSHFGVTPPVSELRAPAPAMGVENYEIPNRPVTELPALPGAQPAERVAGEGFISPDSGVLAPAPAIGFDGNNSDDNQAIIGFRLAPPDTQGAVGIQYYIQWVNLVWSIYDKASGAEVVGPLPGNSLWAAGIPGTDCANYNNGDPITLFDQGAQRWFMSQFGLYGSQYRTCLAVSQTSDPTGAWYVWQYTYGSLMNDYPKFGVWPDGYYMTVNEFGTGQSATTVFDRTAMLAGDASPAAQYFYIEGVQPSFPLPTNWEGGDPPPAGAPNYNAAFYDDSWGNPADILQICEFHVDWTTPANSTFNCPGGAGDPGYIDLTAAGLSFDSNLCGYSRACISQPNGQKVDALSDRVMHPMNYRNLMSTLGYEVMTVTHSVDASGTDQAGVRWYELRNTGSGWFVADGGTIAPDSDNRWMGSSAVDQNGNIGVIYSISSASTYPSVGYTARLATDPPGSMQTEQVLVAGGGSMGDGANRWGDYAAMHVDPDGCSFWGTAEYVNTGGSWIWDTYVGSFSMPGCTPTGFGTAQGTVTDSSSSLPIPGARVEVGAFTTFAQADGTYGVNVPANTYDVTASAFGYAPETANSVVVPDGGAVTQDFALDPLPTSILDGAVTDAGHGWPLYARIDVKLLGSPVAATYTNPFDGLYSIELPDSTAYDLEVTAIFPGYGVGTRSIVLAAGGQTEDFVLTAIAPACTAPGYSAGTPCVLVAGAMVEGFVTDANTGDAIDSATVSNDMGGSTSTMSTPDDPAIGNGYYFLFTPPGPSAPLANTITASATGFANGQATLDFVPETVNQLDFALDAGWLEMVPNHLESRLEPGLTENQPLSALNWGGAAASIKLLAFEKASWVPSMPMDALQPSTVPPGHFNDPTAEAAALPEREPAAPLAAGDVIQSWGSGLGAAWGVTFNQHTGMPWVGEGWGNDTIYEYTVAGAQTGTSYVAPWSPLYGPADYTFDFLTGMIWVMDVGGDECLHELDPATGYTGDTLCWGSPISERGVAYDALGDTFFVGGWNTAAVTRIDRDGNILQIANVGLAISGLAYNPVTEHLFVMTNASPNLVYVLDVPDNYNQIGSFGIAGLSDYGGAGLGISCDGHLWVVNQANEEVLEVDSGESGACLSASLPWLVLTPAEGVVPSSGAEPGELAINAEFIADGLDHYGLVQGRILVLHDTPYDVHDMPVCFTKAFADVAPTFWADGYIHSLAGARITTGCGGGDFCPTDEMPRHVMARWLVKVLHGPDYAVPPCVGMFEDVVCDTTPNADHIEQLYLDGITTGCHTDPFEYCPFNAVNRAQMSAFITRVVYGPEFVPPPATGTMYPDVAAGFWGAPYIEWLTTEGVVSGFPDGTFKPLQATTRAQMSKMVVLAAGLPLCEGAP